MKKVAVLNIFWTSSCGAVLLAYALQQKIRSMGMEPELINYIPPYYEWCHFPKKNKANFERFREKYLCRTRKYEHIEDVDFTGFDTIVVGGDAVWRPERIYDKWFCRDYRVYFLQFLKCPEKYNKISYSASMANGNMDLLEALKPCYGKYASIFNHISIREESAVPFLEEATGKKVYQCCDPTLFYDADYYKQLLNPKSDALRDGGYIYVYLFEADDEVYDFINKFSKSKKVKVIAKCPEPEKIRDFIETAFDDGPSEFVEGIMNADYVISDSYHATIFSIIFKKNFCAFSRGDLSIRVENLLNDLNLQNRYFRVQGEINENIFDECIDYNKIDKKISEYISSADKYLERALNEI